MNLLLLKESDFISPCRARISGRRLEHLRSTLRVKEGSLLKAGMLGGKIGEAKAVSVSECAIELETGSFETEPPPPAPLLMIAALPRPQSLKKLLHFAASSGIKSLFLIGSARVEKSYWSSSAMKPESLEEELILGLEQGVDTILPRLELRRRFKPFVQDELPEICEGLLKLVAHPYGASECPRSLREPCALAIGPEGGFVDYEVELLKEAGFIPVSIGPRILRVEFAAAWLAGRLL